MSSRPNRAQTEPIAPPARSSSDGAAKPLGGRFAAALGLKAASIYTDDRAGRARMLHAAGTALANGEIPDPEAAQFLSTAILAWLEAGGSLERDHLQLAAPRGSHYTIEAFWERLRKPIIDDDDQSGPPA